MIFNDRLLDSILGYSRMMMKYIFHHHDLTLARDNLPIILSFSYFLLYVLWKPATIRYTLCILKS